MEGSISWEQLAYMVGLAGALGTVWWKIHQRIAAVSDALVQYKLESARSFIRAEHLQKVEERLLASETRTLAAIEQLTRRIDSLLERSRVTEK